MRRAVLTVFALLVCQAIGAGMAYAQAARETRLLITVVDQSNAVLPAATVTVTGLEPATQKSTVAPAQAGDNGIAAVGGLVPGRYSVQAEFPGFDPGQLKDVRVRAGDNRHVIVLAIQKMSESVNVGQDAQEGAGDRRGSAFGTALTREQMDALSDDPDEMQRQLQDMAGPGATMRIDSFEGGALPPKSMIKAIHITRDQFAAENHGAEGLFIDIITQPGVGPIRTGLNYQMHNGAMTARNPFSASKGADQVQNYGINLSGGLIRNKASFSFGMRGNSSFDNAILTAVLPGGITSDSLKVRTPRVNQSVSGSFDYAITRDQTLRMSYNQNDGTNKNLGIGNFNLLERAYNTENHSHTFRIQEAGPIGRRFFINTRLNVGWTNTGSHSAVEAPTIRVMEAFTSGGAQIAGGRHSRDMNFASDLDYVRGRHSVRAGTQLDGNWYRSNDSSNYLGTYIFEDLTAYAAGLPRSYTRRVGDPNIRYFNLLGAFYLQDDVRLRRGLTLTPGVRYEAQTHVSDYNNLSPRIGLTWAPFRNGKTTLRASWGLFYDWLPTGTYEQTLRVDGFRQQELQIVNPPYPEVPAAGTVSAVNRYLLDPDLRNARTPRMAGGVDYAFAPQTRISATFRVSNGKEALRGKNLNAPDPITHLRADPTFGNVVQVRSDAETRQKSMSVNMQFVPASALGAGGQGPRWKWNRMALNVGYTLNDLENNTDGAFSTPASGDLAKEWGPSAGSALHRANASLSFSQLRNLNMSINVNVASATPYSITSGRDDNGDLIFNDRPAGVTRNSARGSGQWNSSGYMSYSFTFGPRQTNLPPGIRIDGAGGALSVSTVAPQSLGRYRIAITCQIQNLTNHTNYTGYVGNQLSSLFGKPQSAFGQRRVDVGMNLGF